VTIASAFASMSRVFVEVADGAAGDAERLAGADVGRRALDRPGQDAVESVDPSTTRSASSSASTTLHAVQTLRPALQAGRPHPRRPGGRASDPRAVGEVETAWAKQLGPKPFAQLRDLLLHLDRLT
jgi:hypothetical protein